MGKPRSKRMKNNASSVAKEKELMNLVNNKENMLASKHKQLRNHYLNGKLIEEVKAGDDQNPKSVPNMSAEVQQIQHRFHLSPEITKVMSRSNFPARFPLKLENENCSANVIMQENNENVPPVGPTNTKMTKLFLKFWNRLITKQDFATTSSWDHQLTETQAGYFPCQLKSLFNSPESYVKKSYCQKGRYSDKGYQLLPKSNQFVRINSRAAAKLEMQSIFDYFCNSANHFFFIPIEMSSKLSRCMFKSSDIAKNSQGCNKIGFVCKQNFSENRHPLFTVEYKSSIEMEKVPCSGMSLVENVNSKVGANFALTTSPISKACFNHPYLSHFLHRSDFWIDDFYARCWHYSRFFCDKLNLGNRINNTSGILMKDSLFKYLLSCSARICIAVKYWILNPEGATYFRCWCGQKIYDEKQESRMLNKMQIGSADLFNVQQKIKEHDLYHRKHGEKKANHHICVCNQQFNDHKLWMAHIFSPKISEMNKICPVFLYIVAQTCTQDNHFVCECKESFSDYDFWSFWLHACGCISLKNSIKCLCECNSINRGHKNVIQVKSSAGGVKVQRRKGALKRGRMSRNLRLRSTDKRNKRDFLEEDEGIEVLESGTSQGEETGGNCSDCKENDGKNTDARYCGDKLDLSTKMSKQINFSNCEWKRARK